MPRRENIERIAGFTRYSWLSGIEERSFSAMDTIVLGFFVSQSLIGYYEVAWNIVSLLAIFGTSIAQAMFPLLSQLDSENLDESVAGLINDSLAFSGLFLIPGVVGSFLVGEHILGIYGAEFRQATTVLVLLAVARLVYAYESQFITSLNALDFPGAAFRVNVVFVLANLGLNVALVAAFGWLGAAVGTGLAATIGLVLGYRVLADRIEFRVPTYEIGYQTLAAVVMAIAVVAIQPVFISGQYGSVPETLALVGAGASVYVVALLVLSVRFRTVVADNLSITSTMD